MSYLLNEDSLWLFESEKPNNEEIVEVIESYAEDKLMELGLSKGRDVVTERVAIEGEDVSIDFLVGRKRYTVNVLEWDYSQGVAIPLVELRGHSKDWGAVTLYITCAMIALLWMGFTAVAFYMSLATFDYPGVFSPWFWPLMTLLGVLGTVVFGRLAIKLLLKMRKEESDVFEGRRG